jgi:hypothetical protein
MKPESLAKSHQAAHRHDHAGDRRREDTDHVTRAAKKIQVRALRHSFVDSTSLWNMVRFLQELSIGCRLGPCPHKVRRW